MFIYVEALNIYSFMFYICPWLFKSRKYNTVNIFYFNKLSWFKIIIRLINKYKHINITKFDHEFRNILDENEECINSKFTRNIMFKVKDELLNTNQIKYIFEQITNKNLKQYLKKGIFNGDLKSDINSIPYCIYIILKIKYHMDKYECTNSYLFYKYRPWIYYYSTYARKYNVSLIPIYALNIGVSEFLYNVYYYKIIIVNNIIKYFSFIKKYNNTETKYKILSDTIGEFNLVRDGYNSDLFYYLYSNLQPDRLCANYDNKDEKTQLISNNITPINTNYAAKIFNFKYVSKDSYINKVHFQNNIESKIIKKLIQQYIRSNIYWDNIFRIYNIKVYLTWYKYDHSHIAICNSIRNNNGVMCLWERSFDGQPSPFISVVSDIIFRNTTLGIDNEITNESEINYTVITGFMRDYGLEILRDKANLIKNNLKENGAKYIISIFDQNSTDEYENSKHNENYENILRFILENKDYAVIFKPKKAHTYKSKLKDHTIKLLSTAQKTGRCFVYSSSGKYQSNVPAILAALSSDICIHSHLYAGTAALECAFIGKPTIMIDREGHPYNILNNSGINECIFKNWNDAIYALNEHFTSKSINTNFGNLTPLISDVEPFRDGKGAFRMGSYIQNILEQLELCKDKQTALNNAAEIYSKKWGENSVYVRYNSKKV